MENKLKHLEFIQNVITRFNMNCFIIKGWTITLIVAVFSLNEKNNLNYSVLVYFTILIFWLIDAYYLSQERQYRMLYGDVANSHPSQINFSMDASRYCKGNGSWWKTIFSKTLITFYGFLAVLSFLLILALKK